MYNFEYDIKINEDTDRPYIYLPENYSGEIHHRFMAFELTAYSLNDLVAKYTAKDDIKNKALIEELISATALISDISDNLAKLLKEQHDSFNELNDILKQTGKNDNEDENGEDSI